MELVQPIRDREQIEKVKQVLKAKNTRDYLLFVFGINSALRIGDLLSLRKRDVVEGRVVIREEKTGKPKDFPINEVVSEILKDYLPTLTDDEFLFKSRQANRNGDKVISRQQAYTILTKAFKAAGIKENCSCHSLRKTFGYWHYKTYKDVAKLQKMLNHSAPSVTLRYIGIEQEEIDRSYMEFSL